MGGGACGCSANQIDVRTPKRPLGALEIQILPENLPDKARIYIGSGVMQVGAPWWDSLDDTQRAAIVSHELAHEENPKELCEPCLDMRAGAMMRHFGYSRSAVSHGFSGDAAPSSRNASANAVKGWDAADAAINDGTHVRAYDHRASMYRVKRFEGDADGQSFGVPDVDGTSVETPEIIDQILSGVGGARQSAPPVNAAPRGKAPTTTAPAPTYMSPTTIAIVAALAVAIIAGVVVHALTKGE